MSRTSPSSGSTAAAATVAALIGPVANASNRASIRSVPVPVTNASLGSCSQRPFIPKSVRNTDWVVRSSITSARSPTLPWMTIESMPAAGSLLAVTSNAVRNEPDSSIASSRSFVRIGVPPTLFAATAPSRS